MLPAEGGRVNLLPGLGERGSGKPHPGPDLWLRASPQGCGVECRARPMGFNLPNNLARKKGPNERTPPGGCERATHAPPNTTPSHSRDTPEPIGSAHPVAAASQVVSANNATPENAAAASPATTANTIPTPVTKPPPNVSEGRPFIQEDGTLVLPAGQDVRRPVAVPKLRRNESL
jgi:hypothetical protein